MYYIINPTPPFPLQTCYSQNLQNKFLIKNTFIKPIFTDEFNNFKHPLHNSNKIKIQTDDFETTEEKLM
jgi:hypothetical protein